MFNYKHKKEFVKPCNKKKTKKDRMAAQPGTHRREMKRTERQIWKLEDTER